MYWMQYKSEKNRTEPNELAELKHSKSLTQITSYAHWYILVFACSNLYQNIYSSHSKFKKNWAKWAKWARILKNILTDEQLCSLTCFLVFAGSDKYQNIYSFFRLKIRRKDWTKWAKWAKILKSILNDEQLHSETCFLVFACSNKHQYTSLLILHKIVKNRKKFCLNFS